MVRAHPTVPIGSGTCKKSVEAPLYLSYRLATMLLRTRLPHLRRRNPLLAQLRAAAPEVFSSLTPVATIQPKRGIIVAPKLSQRGGSIVLATTLSIGDAEDISDPVRTQAEVNRTGSSNPFRSASKSLILHKKMSQAQLCRHFRRLAPAVARVGH